MERIKQFLCGIFTGHVLFDKNLEIRYDEKEKQYVFRNVCLRCGKEIVCKIPRKSMEREMYADD